MSQADLAALTAQFKELSKSLQGYLTQIQAAPLPSTVPFTFYHHDAIYQYLTLLPGQTNVEIFRLNAPNREAEIGIIKYVANSWFPNTTLRWYVDDTLLQTIQYQIAAVNSPLKYDIGIPFYKNIYWQADNNDGSSHTFEVLQDGYYAKKVSGVPVTGVSRSPLQGTAS